MSTNAIVGIAVDTSLCATCSTYVAFPDNKIISIDGTWVHTTSGKAECPGQGGDETGDLAQPITVNGKPGIEPSFRGRYVHWDGYPAGVGAALALIVQRDGAAKAVQMLTEAHQEWSTLTGEAEPANSSAGVLVPGYGVAYEEGPVAWIDEDSSSTMHQGDMLPMAEWAYGIVTGTADTAPTILVWYWSDNDGCWKRTDDIATTAHENGAR